MMIQVRHSVMALGLLLIADALVVSVITFYGAEEAHVSELHKMAARFTPTEIRADIWKLSTSDRQVLAKLVQASTIIDALFSRQVWAGNEAMLLDLARNQTAEGHE